MLSGEATLFKWFCLSSKKGSTIKNYKKREVGSKFYPYMVDPFTERD